MLALNNLRSLVALLAVLLLLPADVLEARTRKGDKLVMQGQDFEARMDYERALHLYTEALSTDPKDPGYQLAVRRARFQAAQAHVEAGMKLRQAGDLEQ